MLSVENLSFSFRNLNLFENLSFELESGQLVWVSGANGTGKSTLLSILAGFRQPKAGSVKFLNPKERCDYLGAEYNHLFLKRTAVENLSCWANLQGRTLDMESIRQELKRWSLHNPFFSSVLPVERFSTGMKRRLALARISLSPKKIWLLDEPLFGLDVSAISIFQTRMKRHIEEGGSIILVSHDHRIIDDFTYQTINLNDAKKAQS